MHLAPSFGFSIHLHCGQLAVKSWRSPGGLDPEEGSQRDIPCRQTQPWCASPGEQGLLDFSPPAPRTPAPWSAACTLYLETLGEGSGRASGVEDQRKPTGTLAGRRKGNWVRFCLEQRFSIINLHQSHLPSGDSGLCRGPTTDFRSLSFCGGIWKFTPWDFPGGPVAKTPRFQWRGHKVPFLVRELDPARLNFKTQYSQTNKYDK